MSKNEKGGRGPVPDAADDTGTIEVHDSGQTLEGVLEEEERTALEESGARLRLAQTNFDELKDRHLRKLAEFENMKKRAADLKAELIIESECGKGTVVELKLNAMKNG